MKFLIKEISPSRKELRVSLNSVYMNGYPYYVFGTIDSTFDEGSIDNKYIPPSSSGFNSIGPNPAIIRLIVAYLKDIIGTPSGFANTVLTTKDNKYISIVNIAVDDIDLINLTSDTIPSLVIKLIDPLPSSAVELDFISIEKQVLTTQEQEVYYIPKPEARLTLRGLDYDEEMKSEVGNSDIQKLEYQNYNDLTSSFAHADKTIVAKWLDTMFDLDKDIASFRDPIELQNVVSNIHGKKMETVVDETETLAIEAPASVDTESDDKSKENLLKEIESLIS